MLKEKMLAEAATREQKGETIEAGILRVGASNLEKQEWTRRHKPSPGPYFKEKPLRCVNCGKTIAGKELTGGECLAKN
ncbi:MAG: hypothetical protein PHX30_02170 [Candidatus Pacebacteria bacterium]|nr:hypothetical protein [Candidatus Paceibacterota bacterium]